VRCGNSIKQTGGANERYFNSGDYGDRGEPGNYICTSWP